MLCCFFALLKNEVSTKKSYTCPKKCWGTDEYVSVPFSDTSSHRSENADFYECAAFPVLLNYAKPLYGFLLPLFFKDLAFGFFTWLTFAYKKFFTVSVYINYHTIWTTSFNLVHPIFIHNIVLHPLLTTILQTIDWNF